MLKKTIKYVDYNGTERNEDFYFNLSKAELAKLRMSIDGGWEEWVRKLMSKASNKEIYAVFEEMISNSIGEKSLDGKRFTKNDDIRNAFLESEAYSVLIMELFEDPNKAVDFFKGILPADVQAQIKEEELNNKITEINAGTSDT